MKVIDTTIEDVKVIVPTIFGDERGYFMETWNKDRFEKLIYSVDFVQDNQSKSIKNTLRGLHFQTHNSQGKLVRVIQGEVFDVAVDLRQDSSTYGKWVGEYLTSDNKKQLWIPPGFAHGFLVLSDTAEFSYKCSNKYTPEHEYTLKWNDSDINIEWPLSDLPLLSEKDEQGLCFKEIPKIIG